MNDFNDILNFDPLREAEKITGASYHRDPYTLAVGVELFQAHAKHKEEELALRMDIYRSIPFADALAIIVDLGFEEVLFDTMVDPEGKFTELKVFWRAGVLLLAESRESHTRDAQTGRYEPYTALNRCAFYYNWVPNDYKHSFPYTSSGQFSVFRDGRKLSLTERTAEGDLWVWAGNHDMVDGLRHHIAQLEDHGTFLSGWKSYRRPWLLAHREGSDEQDREEAIRNRLSRLPVHVRRAMGVDALGCPEA